MSGSSSANAAANAFGQAGGSVEDSVLGNGGAGGGATSHGHRQRRRSRFSVISGRCQRRRGRAARALRIDLARAARRLPPPPPIPPWDPPLPPQRRGRRCRPTYGGREPGIGGLAIANATTNGSTIQQILGPTGAAGVVARWYPGLGTTFHVGLSNVNVGTVTVTGIGGLIDGITGIGTLTVGNGAAPTDLQLASNSGGSTQSALTIMNGSMLDLENNHFLINYAGTDPVATIRGYLTSGYNGGAWNGPGIDT